MYIDSPSISGTLTNKYALVTEPGSGNVGIGTTSPAQKLHVDGHTLISAEKYYYVAGTGGGLGSDSSGNLILRQNSANLMTTSGSNATFAGDLTVTGTDIRTGASNGLDLGDDSSILTIGRTNEIWTQQDVNADATLYLNYRGYNAASSRFRSFDIRDGKAGQIALFNGTDKSTTFGGGVTIPDYITRVTMLQRFMYK